MDSRYGDVLGNPGSDYPYLAALVWECWTLPWLGLVGCMAAAEHFWATAPEWLDCLDCG